MSKKKTKKLPVPVLLESQIRDRREEIKTDSYAMSIGELASLYRNGELNIHPEFQRFFRWTDQQKSNFIESILLGIPIPSIFLSQTADAKWEVVDGLQRLSTIFQLMGILLTRNNTSVDKLVLKPTKYLGTLGARFWPQNDTEAAHPNALSAEVQLLVKRAKLDLKIVLRETAHTGKYELFRRLNTGGSFATDQEVRSCIVIMTDSSFFEWQNSLAKDPNFLSCVALSDRLENEQFHLELVTRFLVFRHISTPKPGELEELGEFLTDHITDIAADKEYDRKANERAFRATFQLLASTTGDESFRRYDSKRKRFMGSFLISAFEVIALGLASRSTLPSEEQVNKKIRSLWSNKKFLGSIGSGVSAANRIPRTIEIGRQVFKK